MKAFSISFQKFTDIALARKKLGFEPRTPIAEGIPKFLKWFREYHSGEESDA